MNKDLYQGVVDAFITIRKVLAAQDQEIETLTEERDRALQELETALRTIDEDRALIMKITGARP